MKNCDGLCRIGPLARKAGVPKSTIHYYCQMGLLEPSGHSPGGYRLFNEDDCLKKIKTIRDILASKMTLVDIKEKLEAGVREEVLV